MNVIKWRDLEEIDHNEPEDCGEHLPIREKDLALFSYRLDSKAMMFVQVFLVACLISAARAQGPNIRIVGGSTTLEGRVEVNVDGEWGTVCDDYWDITDANVVCQSLGLGDAVDAPGSAQFGEGTGSIFLDDVSCEGSEASIFDCGNNGIEINNCGHGEDAGVRCAGPNVRLVDGSTALEGRVEVFADAGWGTVCDDSWNLIDANVVCQSLGLGDAFEAVSFAGFGEGTGSILLDDVACSGSEASIFECGNAGIGINNCNHREDAGVRCIGEYNTRLVEGATIGEGRVEVNVNGTWGTVCDDSWDLTDAHVVCQSLGLSYAIEAVSFAGFGEGTGSILLDDVSCSGSEASIFECGNAGIGINNCNHREDAGVRCIGVRLANGDSDSEGRVEVYYNGAWGTVCDDDWDDSDAGVVCSSLGYTRGGTAETNAAFGEGEGNIILDDVQCTGSEPHLKNCPNAGLGINNCHHREDAGVRCSEGPVIRLVGGITALEGRVEVYADGQWGTVCDDSWDINDARTVCRSLGLGGAAEAVSRAGFGEGTGSILLDDVTCTGSETNIFLCQSSGIGINNCAHSEDAGVRCAGVRLVDGSYAGEGRVEVLFDGVWGTVCDDFWDDTDASVICRHLGYGDSGTARGSAYFGEGTGPIHLDDIECTGNELDIFQCPNNPIRNCIHSEDAGVSC